MFLSISEVLSSFRRKSIFSIEHVSLSCELLHARLIRGRCEIGLLAVAVAGIIVVSFASLKTALGANLGCLSSFGASFVAFKVLLVYLELRIWVSRPVCLSLAIHVLHELFGVHVLFFLIVLNDSSLGQSFEASLLFLFHFSLTNANGLEVLVNVEVDLSPFKCLVSENELALFVNFLKLVDGLVVLLSEILILLIDEGLVLQLL
jgi:hypothetical protein